MPRKSILIVGGGPAGMMSGLLLARAGCRVTVLEKHSDFLRDFRGDTVHPSTLELFDQLGWLEEVLQIRHGRVEEIGVELAGRFWRAADFRHLDVAAPYIAMMPQWDLLDFLARKAGAYPGFELRMAAEAVSATRDPHGRIDGVLLADGEWVGANLVIAADGRRSILREDAALPLETIGAPMDVFWFRLDKSEVVEKGDSFGVAAAGRLLIFIDRIDYYQCAFVFEKDGATRLRDQGLANFRDELKRLVPRLSGAVDALQDWDDIKLLSVSLDRLTRWHRPGLLVTGDAAHAMSPIGGVGINVAVQDAVATANVLAAPLARGDDPDPLLAEVQQRRWKSVRRMQVFQKFAQDRIIEPLLKRERPFETAPLPLRLLDRVALLRRLPGRIVGMGFDPQRIESPDAFS